MVVVERRGGGEVELDDVDEGEADDEPKPLLAVGALRRNRRLIGSASFLSYPACMPLLFSESPHVNFTQEGRSRAFGHTRLLRIVVVK